MAAELIVAERGSNSILRRIAPTAIEVKYVVHPNTLPSALQVIEAGGSPMDSVNSIFGSVLFTGFGELRRSDVPNYDAAVLQVRITIEDEWCKVVRFPAVFDGKGRRIHTSMSTGEHKAIVLTGTLDGHTADGAMEPHFMVELRYHTHGMVPVKPAPPPESAKRGRVATTRSTVFIPLPIHCFVRPACAGPSGSPKVKEVKICTPYNGSLLQLIDGQQNYLCVECYPQPLLTTGGKGTEGDVLAPTKRNNATEETNFIFRHWAAETAVGYNWFAVITASDPKTGPPPVGKNVGKRVATDDGLGDDVGGNEDQPMNINRFLQGGGRPIVNFIRSRGFTAFIIVIWVAFWFRGALKYFV